MSLSEVSEGLPILSINRSRRCDSPKFVPPTVNKTISLLGEWPIGNIEIFSSKWCNIDEFVHCRQAVCFFFISTKGAMAMQAGWYTEPLICSYKKSPYILLFFKTETNKVLAESSPVWSCIFIVLNISRKGKKSPMMIPNMVIFDTNLIKTYLLRIESNSITNWFNVQIPLTQFEENIQALNQSWWWAWQTILAR